MRPSLQASLSVSSPFCSCSSAGFSIPQSHSLPVFLLREVVPRGHLQRSFQFFPLRYNFSSLAMPRNFPPVFPPDKGIRSRSSLVRCGPSFLYPESANFFSLFPALLSSPPSCSTRFFSHVRDVFSNALLPTSALTSSSSSSPYSLSFSSSLSPPLHSVSSLPSDSSLSSTSCASSSSFDLCFSPLISPCLISPTKAAATCQRQSWRSRAPAAAAGGIREPHRCLLTTAAATEASEREAPAATGAAAAATTGAAAAATTGAAPAATTGAAAAPTTRAAAADREGPAAGSTAASTAAAGRAAGGLHVELEGDTRARGRWLRQQQQRGLATAAAGEAAGGGGWLGLQQKSLLNSWHTIAIVEKISATPIRPMTIKRLLQLEPANEASLLKGAEWIREELPVRLSHRLYDFHRLPLVAVAQPLIFSVYESYLTTFDRTRKLSPIATAQDLRAFIKIVEKERSTHDRTVDYMGQGVRQLRRVCRDVDLNAFLERFFYFRIGRRVMIDQLVHLQREQKGWRGIIHLECHAAKVIEQRARDVREACRSTYGIAPPVLLTGNTEMRFATIPDHLALIITEILKNAVRATVEFHTMGNSLVDATTRSLIQDDEDLPEVKVEVYKGKREVVIKVSDKGGGVPPAKLPEIWSFGYSTVTESNTKIQESSSLGPSFIRSDMAGYGFGLPLARAFARYFGGDIHVQSHFGIGTDVYITLNHIGDQEEALYFEERSDLRMGQKLSNETS